uniref:Uncharacterized protein n=1 Tax=Helianthus annuus TaxID=4232 RepID=A0A251S1X8_HELAN
MNSANISNCDAVQCMHQFAYQLVASRNCSIPAFQVRLIHYVVYVKSIFDASIGLPISAYL